VCFQESVLGGRLPLEYRRSPGLKTNAEPHTKTRLRANPGRHETRGYGWTSNTAPQPPGCSPAQWVTLKSKSPPANAETEDATVSVDCNVIAQPLGSRQASSKKYIESFPVIRGPGIG